MNGSLGPRPNVTGRKWLPGSRTGCAIGAHPKDRLWWRTKGHQPSNAGQSWFRSHRCQGFDSTRPAEPTKARTTPSNQATVTFQLHSGPAHYHLDMDSSGDEGS